MAPDLFSACFLGSLAAVTMIAPGVAGGVAVCCGVAAFWFAGAALSAEDGLDAAFSVSLPPFLDGASAAVGEVVVGADLSAEDGLDVLFSASLPPFLAAALTVVAAGAGAVLSAEDGFIVVFSVSLPPFLAGASTVAVGAGAGEVFSAATVGFGVEDLEGGAVPDFSAVGVVGFSASCLPPFLVGASTAVVDVFGAAVGFSVMAVVCFSDSCLLPFLASAVGWGVEGLDNGVAPVLSAAVVGFSVSCFPFFFAGASAAAGEVGAGAAEVFCAAVGLGVEGLEDAADVG